MIKRLLLVLLASAVSTAAQTNASGTKNRPSPALPSVTAAPAAKTIAKADEDENDNSVVITIFRTLTTPKAKTKRTFQLSKVDKLGAPETSKELLSLCATYAKQQIVDGSPAGTSKATGYLTTVTYSLIQDLGDNRFLAKAAWPASDPNESLPAVVDTMAVLLLEKPAKVGDTGKITGMHVGTVAVLFTATYPPLVGKRLTLRREAFVECTTLEDSPASRQKLFDAVNAGADISAVVDQKISCKTCGGLGKTREPQKGSLFDKLTTCVDCDKGKVTIWVEVKLVP